MQKAGNNRRQAIKSGATAALTAAAVASDSPVRAEKSYDTIIGRFRTGDSAHKQAARSDYSASMQQFGGSLSSLDPPDSIPGRPGQAQFDVLIVGSGYGASIFAARLAQRRLPSTRIAVLERGAEWVPGDFPDTLGPAAKQSRLEPLLGDRRKVINPTGLYNIVQTDELMIVTANGLGGGSLLNANVVLRPDREVFEQHQWPRALQCRDFLEPYFERAAWELGTQLEPIDFSRKMRAQRIAAERLSDIGCHFEASALTITRSGTNAALPILNRQGMLQRNCIDCGDCMTGCNIGAKNTLAMNYLPLARRHGAMIFSQCEVVKIHPADGHYVVEYMHHCRDDKGAKHSSRRFVTTRMVVLGAGSLGSTEILLRSQQCGFEFSSSLGCSWTANGDALGFVDNSKLCPLTGGTSAYNSDVGPGPTIQSNLTFPYRPHLHDRVLIQDDAACRVYANILGGLFLDMNLDSTMVLTGMGHDGQRGRVVLHSDGYADIHWPGIREGAYRKKIRQEFANIAAAHGGKYRHLNPPHDRMITVHPMGGCSMSDDPRNGVVDDRGRVFNFANGGDCDSDGRGRTYDGLYVCDGAVIPTAIAVNPFITISAVAERNAHLMTLEPEFSDLFVPV